MQRVGWIAACIMGVLLIGLTTGLWMQRWGTSPPEVVLLAVSNGPRNTYQLALVLRADGRELWRGLPTGTGGIMPLSTSPDGQWLYLREVEAASTGYHLSTKRIRLDGLHIEPLPAFVPTTSIFWSPDGQWIVYKQVDRQTGREQLFRASPDGRRVQNLTAQFAPTVGADYPFPPVISPDNDWVVFNGFQQQDQVYRVDVPSGQITALSDGPTPSYIRGYVHNASGDWLLITKVDGEYRIRLDGSELTPLLPHVHFSGNTILVWPAARLILIQPLQDTATLYALSMDDFSLRWKLPDLYIPEGQVMGARILGYGADGWVYTLDAHGLTKRVAQLFTNMPMYELSPDSRRLVYTMGGGLYVVTLADGHERELHRSAAHLTLLAWGKDGQSVVMEDDYGTGSGLWRVWLNDGRHQRLLDYQSRGYFLAVGRLANWAFHPLALLGLGGVLVVGVGVGMKQQGKANS